MAALIVLNGPPGVGKSTLAARYVADHPLALDLDIDRIRDLLGCWQEQPGDAGLAARAIAIAAARVHLRAGHDVVIPQLLARPLFLEQLDALVGEFTSGEQTGPAVSFVEIVLLDTKENTRARMRQRTEQAAHAAHVEAGAMMQRMGGEAELDRMYDRLVALLPSRPAARVVRSSDGEVDRTYEAVLDVVETVR